MSDDNDKTVFGGKLPDPSQLRNPSGPGGQAPASSSPFDNAGGMPGQPLGQPPHPVHRRLAHRPLTMTAR